MSALATLALRAVLAASAAPSGIADTVPPLAAVAVEERVGEPVPLDARLVDEEGRPLRFGALFREGRPVLLVPGWFRCRMLCGVVLEGVKRGLAGAPAWRPGHEVVVAMVSIDPREGPADARDRRDRLFSAAANDPDVVAGWHFLSGPESEVRRITDALGFGFRYDPDTDQYAHAALVAALSPDGRIARYLYGVSPAPDTLAGALADARDGRATASLEAVLVRCFRYLPALRRHAGLVAGVLRGGGLLILLGLAGVFLLAARRGTAGSEAVAEAPGPGSPPAERLSRPALLGLALQGDPSNPVGGVFEAFGEILHWLLALPPQASTFAREVDALQYVEVVGLWAIGVVLLGATATFVVRWRRRGDVPPRITPRVTAPLWVELGFAGLLLAMFLGWWVIGFRQFARAQAPPAPGEGYEVYVEAKQWTWKFDYPEGRSTAGVLYLPLDRETRLVITSRDVIHSFFVPDFRVKQDAVPGRYTAVRVTPTLAGPHQLLCAEFCGTGHSRMWGRVVVLEPEAFDRWAATGVPPEEAGPVGPPAVLHPADSAGRVEAPLHERGRRAAARLGCLGCHTVDGTPHLAPTWRGLWGRREALADGDTVTVDAAYVTESMMDPMAKLVAGYPPIMPSFQGQVEPADAAGIIEYLKILDDEGPPMESAP